MAKSLVVKEEKLQEMSSEEEYSVDDSPRMAFKREFNEKSRPSPLPGTVFTSRTLDPRSVVPPASPTLPLNQFLNMLTNPGTPIEEKKALMMKPYPKEYGVLECTVRRDTSGLAQKMYPKYELVLSGSYKHVLTAKRVSFVRSSHYVITIGACDFVRSSPECLGKLRSNSAGTEYNVFDHGENPDSSYPLSKIRTQLGSIIFVRNLPFEQK